MAVREILRYPNKLLQQKSEQVKEITKDICSLVDDMLETMYAYNGVGLAAPQIGVLKRIFVVDIYDNNGPLIFINPEIVYKSGKIKFREGCLSFPNAYEEIERNEKIEIKAQEVSGNWFQIETSGLLSVAIQHEYDHLNGKLMIDYMSPLKKRLFLKQVNKR